MVVPFPIIKLIYILIVQISRPISNQIKDNAKKSQLFRNYVCIPPAQLFNQYDIRIKMWMLGRKKAVKIPILNEARAVDLGATLLSEGFIFLVAGGVMVNEVYKSMDDSSMDLINAEKQELSESVLSMVLLKKTQTEELKLLIETMADLGADLGDELSQEIHGNDEEDEYIVEADAECIEDVVNTSFQDSINLLNQLDNEEIIEEVEIHLV